MYPGIDTTCVVFVYHNMHNALRMYTLEVDIICMTAFREIFGGISFQGGC